MRRDTPFADDSYQTGINRLPPLGPVFFQPSLPSSRSRLSARTFSPPHPRPRIAVKSCSMHPPWPNFLVTPTNRASDGGTLLRFASATIGSLTPTSVRFKAPNMPVCLPWHLLTVMSCQIILPAQQPHPWTLYQVSVTTTTEYGQGFSTVIFCSSFSRTPIAPALFAFSLLGLVLPHHSRPCNLGPRR
ncbi:hypothetical protein LZ31DRAFT_50662 [Colletotrichum somersetense]|nr:hypothetical protein LZ31DRAFT_50662 [Colletotrichum somersetense]